MKNDLGKVTEYLRNQSTRLFYGVLRNHTEIIICQIHNVGLVYIIGKKHSNMFSSQYAVLGRRSQRVIVQYEILVD